MDRKTARRYVEAAQEAGLTREAAFAAVDDAVIGQVVEVVRPPGPAGHGASWDALEARHDHILAWVKGDKDDPPLSGLANNARTINLGPIDMRRQRGQPARAATGSWE